MKTTFAAAALAVVLLMGNQSLSLAQWGENEVTVRGMFGDRVMGDTFKPRPSKFGGTLQRGPSGNFLGRAPKAQGRMFNPASAAPRYRAPVVPPAPLPQPVGEPRLLPEYQPPLPLPQPEPFQPFRTVPSEPTQKKSDVWMRAPPSPSNGGSAVPGPQVGQPADFGPAPGSGAGYALPLSIQYALGFDTDVPRPIRQVSQGSYFASSVADRLQKMLGNRARSPISVSLIDGTATVRGQVATQNDRRLITYLVMFEPGIRRVNNQVSTEVPSLLSGSPGR
jgi:hypothetical protein